LAFRKSQELDDRHLFLGPIFQEEITGYVLDRYGQRSSF